MKITVSLTNAELEEMGVTPVQLQSRIVQQLDEARIDSAGPAIELCGYDVVVQVAA